MPTATQVLKGTVTTDGLGAGSVSIVTTGYRIRGITVRNIGLTGGTISAKDNNGAGAELLPAVAQPAATLRRVFGGPSVATSPLVIAVTGGGATKAFRYEVELVRVGNPAYPVPMNYYSSCVTWYDLTDINTLYQDAARTTRVTAASDPVGGVLDKVGTAHLSQSVANARPLWTPGAPTPGLAFDGTNDQLITTLPAVAQPNTIFVVCRPNGAVGGGRRVFDNQGGAGGRQVLDRTGTNLWQAWAGSFYGTATATDNVPVIIAAHYNGVNSKLWVGGGAPATGNPGVNASNDGFRLGAESTSSPTWFWIGLISEFGLFSGALSLDQINNIAENLRAKHSNNPAWTTAT